SRRRAARQERRLRAESSSSTIAVDWIGGTPLACSAYEAGLLARVVLGQPLRTNPTATPQQALGHLPGPLEPRGPSLSRPPFVAVASGSPAGRGDLGG